MFMLSVFICEDNEHFRGLVCEHVTNFIAMERLDIEVALSTDDPAKIIKHIKNSKVNGLYILDVELNDGYNGIEVANTIRQHDPRGFVVFVTAHPRYMSLTFKYKVEALGYIHKDEKEAGETVKERIYDCIRDAYNKHVSRSDDGCFIFKTYDGQQISCAIDDILFFETDAPGTNRLILHTKKRNYTFYGTLERVVLDLPMGLFHKCHKSYIVNIGNISEKNRVDLVNGADRITMQNGAYCMVSQRRKHGLLRALNAN